MLDVVSVGNATMDVFVEIDAKKKGRNIVLPCGSKQEVKSIFTATGGGATNTAVSFSSLGLKTGILAAIGKDENGKAIIQELRKEKVDTSMVVQLPAYRTAYSAIITGKGFNRVILVYGGATTHLQKEKQVKWGKLAKAKWVYVSSFHSKPALLKKIFSFAAKKGIKIAWNPGKSEIAQGIGKLKPMLSKTRVLFLNKEEAKMMAGRGSVRANFRKLQKLVPLVVVTKGKKGSLAFDGKKVYRKGTHKIKVKDTTGAGDAFNSGFLSAIIWGRGIEKALELGTKNAESIITKIGAKNNFLSKKEARTYT